MNRTTIEWTDFTWNPVTGCNKVSTGCKNCYAENVATRFWGDRDFTEVKMHEDRLHEVMQIKKWSGKKVFVCSMSDLFHEKVTFEFIRLVFNLFYYHPTTTFQIVTKRPARALEFFKWASPILVQGDPHYRPVENVWIGVSCENQATADERIPLLLQIPAAVRFLSCEPLLNELHIYKFLIPQRYQYKGESEGYTLPGINWVIAGGESGHKARPMHPDWVRSLRDQCAAANVPFFFKQWGEYRPFQETYQPPFYMDCATGEEHDGHVMNFIDYDHHTESGKFNGFRWYPLMDSMFISQKTKGKSCSFLKMGKSKSGNLLDGVEHKAFPVIK